MLRLFTDRASDAHRAEGHPERPERLHAALAGVEAWHGSIEQHTHARRADDATLLTVHTQAHLDEVAFVARNNAWFDPDTYARAASDDAARRAVTCALDAARSAASGIPALALARPPGHHAEPARGMGFCLYNQIAIAAAALRRQGRRVAVLDIDVHHGNGTQNAFYDDPQVLYVSLHQSPHYPGTGRIDETGRGAGRGFNVNLPVPPGTGHDGWLEVYDHVVPQVLGDFVPEVLLVSLGFDGHRRDPLASLRLVAQTYHAAIARARQVTRNIAVVLEGGYDLDAIRDGVTNVCAALAGEACVVEEPAPEGVRAWAAMRSEVVGHHGAAWCIR